MDVCAAYMYSLDRDWAVLGGIPDPQKYRGFVAS